MSDPISDLIAEGFVARKEHRPVDALAAFNQAVALSRETSDQPMLALAFTGLGRVERDLNHNESSLGHYRAAVEVYREQKNWQGLAHAIRHAADILRHESRFEEAEYAYIEALEIYRKHFETKPLNLGNAIRGLALLKGALGDSATSEQLWQEARTLYESLGIQAGVDESDAQLRLLLIRE